jgi:hypothetical protein
MIRIRLERARKLLKQAVDTQGPDFVYNSGGNGACDYLPTRRNRSTGCLIGVALGLAGVDVNRLGAGAVCALAPIWRAKDIVQLDHKTTKYFTVAQAVQDTGGTWGEALEAAEDSLNS